MHFSRVHYCEAVMDVDFKDYKQKRQHYFAVFS